MKREHDKLEPATLSIEQLADWARDLPEICTDAYAVRPHHLDCMAIKYSDQRQCNCNDLIFPDDEYYRPGSPLHPTTHKDTEL
jgi:hypothetical protein